MAAKRVGRRPQVRRRGRTRSVWILWIVTQTVRIQTGPVQMRRPPMPD